MKALKAGVHALKEPLLQFSKNTIFRYRHVSIAPTLQPAKDDPTFENLFRFKVNLPQINSGWIPDFAFIDISTPEDKTKQSELLGWVNEQCQANQLNDELGFKY